MLIFEYWTQNFIYFLLSQKWKAFSNFPSKIIFLFSCSTSYLFYILIYWAINILCTGKFAKNSLTFSISVFSKPNGKIFVRSLLFLPWKKFILLSFVWSKILSYLFVLISIKSIYHKVIVCEVSAIRKNHWGKKEEVISEFFILSFLVQVSTCIITTNIIKIQQHAK